MAVLSLLFSDMVFSSSLVLDEVWSWLCHFALSGTVHVTYSCENLEGVTTPSVNMTCGANATLIYQNELNQTPLLISRVWYLMYFTSSLTSAWWCLILAISIYVTTHVKWVGDDVTSTGTSFSSRSNMEELISTHMNDSASVDGDNDVTSTIQSVTSVKRKSPRKLFHTLIPVTTWIIVVIFFLTNCFLSSIWLINGDKETDYLFFSILHFIFPSILTLVS